MTTGLILAGGKSQRMGQDKSLLVLAGRTLIERALDALRPLCDELLIATNAPHPYEHLHVRTVPDRFLEGGSLAGLQAGLTAAAGEPVIAVACDMPFLNTGLLRYLVSLSADVDAVVPNLSGSTLSERAGATGDNRPKAKHLDLHPLHAVYRRTCLPAIEAQLCADDRRMMGFLDHVRTRYVTRAEVLPFDSQLHSFFNANTPGEWAEAERIARSRLDAGVAG